MKRLSVLLISNLFPTPEDPGRGVFTAQIASRLRDLCDLTVICPLPWFPRWARGRAFSRWEGFSRVPRSYTWEGLEVHSPKYPMIPRLSEAAHAALMFPSLHRTVARLHQAGGFDAMNTHWLYPDGVAAALSARRLGIPHVLTALGCDANLFMRQGHKRPQIQWALRGAAGVTAVSDALRQFLLEQGVGARRIDVIPNGADGSVFRPRDQSGCVRRLGLTHDGKAIVFVGQLLEVKGITYLIEAVARLVSRGTDLTVYLVGEGSGRAQYEAEIARRGLEGRIRLVGNRPHGEIAEWMGAGDVFCLPSIREGFPNVVLEALFCGRPVVASRVGGIPEMVDERNGRLFSPRDPEALAAALQCALDRRWDSTAIAASVSHFSWERAAESYLRALEVATNADASGRS